VFNARGLVGYEGRLKAEIRVILLPEGRDPDEIILADPQKWEALVAGSQPIVRFVFQHLLSQVDPSEPKAKATIVDTMLPLLRDIENTTEREAYAQEIANKLGLNPNSLLDLLRAKDRTEAIRQQAAVKSTENQAPAIDQERYALTLLIKHPTLLEGANRQLAEQGLAAINERDFSTVMRMIWAAWMRIQAAPQTEWQDYLNEEMLAQVRQLESVDLPETRLEQRIRELIRSITQIREKSLRGLIEEVQGMISAAQAERDTVAMQQQVKTLQSLLDELKRVHKSLAWRPGIG
jgi:DNA primase